MLEAGEYTAARSRYEESVPLFRLTDDTRGLAQALLGLGKAAMRDGAPAYAEGVFAEAVACWKDQTLAHLRAQLDPQGFAAAWSEGQAMTLDEAIADVLERDHRSL